MSHEYKSCLLKLLELQGCLAMRALSSEGCAAGHRQMTIVCCLSSSCVGCLGAVVLLLEHRGLLLLIVHCV